MSQVPGGIGGTPPGAALDQFLRDSYEVVQAVHRNLDSIRAVADHLTPVEDLVEFQNEVTALYAKLGVLVAASELIVQASDAGIDLLLAVDAEAQRALLGLKSAALQEASYFATSTDFTALSLQVAGLNDTVQQILTDLATKVSQAELDAALAPLLLRLADLEDGVDVGLGDVNARVTQLISELDAGYGFADAAALDSLTTRVAATETGLVSEAQRTTALEADVLDLTNGVAGNATALNQLTVRVESNEAGIDSLATDVTSLNTSVANLETEQTAQSNALQSLGSRTTTIEGTISSQAAALTQLDAEITDAANQAQLNSTAISGLETRVSSNELEQTVISQQYDQLSARVLDTETGIAGQADALSNLTTRVTAAEGGLQVASEERTSLRSSLTSTGNLLPNAGFAANVRGWTLFSRGDGWLDAQLARNVAPTAPGALPEGMFALSLTQDEVPAGNAGIRCSSIPVEDLATYLLSGYLAAENCTARLEWRIFNGAGQEIAFGLAGQVTNVAPSARLSEWTRVHGDVPVPLDGAQLQVQLWVTNCNTGYPKVWLLRPQLEPKVGDQQGPSPWMEGMTGVEETYSTAVQSLETRVGQTESELDTLAQAITDLDSQVGSVREWRIVHHSGSGLFSEVGSPLAPGLYPAGSAAPAHTFLRGMTLLQFDLQANLATATRYDIFSNATERNNLRDALLALTADDAFILVSQDHHGIKQADLTAAIESVGGYAFASVVGSKPYILVGRGLAGKGSGLEVFQAGSTPWQDFYVTVVNDTPKGVGERTGIVETLAGQASALESLTTRVTSNESGITALSSSVTSLEARVDTTESNISAQGSAISGLDVRITATEGEVDNLAQDVTTLQAELDVAEQNISANATAASQLSSRVTTAENGITALSAENVALETRLDNAEANITSSSSAISGLTTRVDDVEGELTTQANSITSLQSGLESIGGGNIIPNSSFEDPSVSDPTRALKWNKGQSAGVVSTSSLVDVAFPHSTKAMRVESASVPQNSYIEVVAALDGSATYPAIEGGKTYSWSALARGTLGAEFRTYLQWMDANDALLSTSAFATGIIASGGWQRLTLSDTAPAGATQVRVRAARLYNLDPAAVPLFLEVDNVQVQEGSTATAYAPSVLYGDEVNASAIQSLETRVTDAEGEISAVTTAQTALSSRVGDMEGALVNEIITSANKDAAHTASINNLSARMTDAEGDIVGQAGAISSLDTRVTNAEGTISSQGSQLTSLQAQVNAMDADTGGYGSAIASLDTRVTANEDAIESQSAAITALENSVTSANKIFVQDDPPPTTGRTNGDLWIDTNDGNKPYTFNSSTNSWQPRQDSNKNKIYVQATAPTGANVNDLWFDSDDNFRVYRWTGSAWAEVTDPRTAANASAISSLTTRVTNVEGVNTSQASAITSINARLDSPTTGLSALATATNELDTRVSDAEGDITAQASSLQSLSTTVNGHTATISQHATSINGLKAGWGVTLDVNGYISGLFSENNGSKANFTILADKFRIVAPGVAAKQLFSVDGSGVHLANDLNIGPGRIVLDTGSHMKVLGQGFGSANQFVEWFGPKMALNQCTELNAITYVKTNGSAYFGGTLSAGILKNAVTSSQISKTASVSTGTIGSNGGSRVVACSFSFENSGFMTGDQRNTFPRNVSVVMTLKRGATTLQSFTVNGEYTAELYDSEVNTTRIRCNFGGSFTHTDNSGGLSTEYNLTLSGATGQWPLTLQYGDVGQRLTIVSTEQ